MCRRRPGPPLAGTAPPSNRYAYPPLRRRLFYLLIPKYPRMDAMTTPIPATIPLIQSRRFSSSTLSSMLSIARRWLSSRSSWIPCLIWITPMHLANSDRSRRVARVSSANASTLCPSTASVTLPLYSVSPPAMRLLAVLVVIFPIVYALLGRVLDGLVRADGRTDGHAEEDKELQAVIETARQPPKAQETQHPEQRTD